VATYVSSLTPTALGSGGSGGYGLSQGDGGASGAVGGGAIRLVVSGSLTDNGIISANGSSVRLNAGGGSGGSIYVTTSTITGSGIFTANGGAVAAAATGGEGGRIAIYYQNASSYTGFTTSTATGGANTGGGNAGAGTIGFFDTSQANNRLYVYKLFSLDPSTTATYDAITVENAGSLTIGGGSAIALTNTVTVTLLLYVKFFTDSSSSIIASQ
jgi:hypothetical protein